MTKDHKGTMARMDAVAAMTPQNVPQTDSVDLLREDRDGGHRKTAKNQSPRERAARALCRRAGNPEDTKFEGRPMWMSYLDEVDAVLQAALTAEEWRKLREAEERPR